MQTTHSMSTRMREIEILEDAVKITDMQINGLMMRLLMCRDEDAPALRESIEQLDVLLAHYKNRLENLKRGQPSPPVA